MSKTTRNAVFGLAVGAVALLAAPRASKAALTVALEPAPGVNLSALTVGEQFELDLVYSSDNSFEQVTRQNGVPSGSFSNLTILSQTIDPHLMAAANHTTSPDLTAPGGFVGVRDVVEATAPGSGSIFVDFDLNQSGGNFVETNEKSSYFFDTNTLNFTVGATAVPEPASAGILGMAGVGLLGRRRRRSAASA